MLDYFSIGKLECFLKHPLSLVFLSTILPENTIKHSEYYLMAHDPICCTRTRFKGCAFASVAAAPNHASAVSQHPALFGLGRVKLRDASLQKSFPFPES